MGSPTAYSPFYGVWFHDKLYNAIGDADQNTIPEQFVYSVEYQMNKFDRECQIRCAHATHARTTLDIHSFQHGVI